MATKYDAAIATEIIQSFNAKPEMLVQILHAFITRYSYVSEQAIRQIANEINLSRAEVHGVVSYYHDFRTEPPGKHVVKICQAESCQAMGSRELTAHAEQTIGAQINSTTKDGNITLEPIYCLGNCACSPAIMIDEKVYGRVDAEKLDGLIDRCARS
ncbi:MAG: formate dehydrogenase subunit gamma [Woeseiaceae bacterium]|jgi:formate dehydrogenase subunit gamma